MQIPEDQIEQIVDTVVKEMMEEIRKELDIFKRELLSELMQMQQTPLPSGQQATPTSPVVQKVKSLKDWW